MSQAAQQSAPPVPPRIDGFVDAVLGRCLDIGAIWSLGHQPAESCMPSPSRPVTLLAFADAGVLARLRKSDHLHRPDYAFLVVVDGDAFASAWGPNRSGSLARWAWRQTARNEAYYDEPQWAEDASGAVVRVRRKAFLVRVAIGGAGAAGVIEWPPQ